MFSIARVGTVPCHWASRRNKSTPAFTPRSPSHQLVDPIEQIGDLERFL
jgi:hypothetical protein